MTERRTISGREWVGPTAEIQRVGLKLKQHLKQHREVPQEVGNVLAAHSIKPEDASSFLDPRLEDWMPDLTQENTSKSKFHEDMWAAAERLAGAVIGRESVGIFGDYDVDGACSVTILKEWFGRVGIRAEFEIPHRINHGYGPNPEAMRRLAEKHKLIIAVDCGSAESSADAVLAAREQGADVVVLDHHVCGTDPHWASAMVNPKRYDDSELDYLCATGVVYMMIVAVSQVLKREDWWNKNGVNVPDTKAWLDLVALATVADVVPLHDLNRAFVRHGLAKMRKRSSTERKTTRPGLLAIAERAKLRDVVTESAISFSIAPRLNAPGRVGDNPSLAVELLLATDEELELVASLADQCERLNTTRRDLQHQAMREARDQLKVKGAHEHLCWVFGESWHAGVVGIIAGHLVDLLDVPVIVLTSDGDRVKGSGRAPAGYDLGAAVRAACDANILIRGGGHATAVGIEMEGDRVDAAKEYIAHQLANGLMSTREERGKVRYCGNLRPGGVNWEFYEAVQSIGPYGFGFPQPRFVVDEVEVLYCKKLGNGSFRLTVKEYAGKSMKAMVFNSTGTPLGDYLENLQYDPTGGRGRRVDLLGTVEPDTYNNACKAFLRVEDMRVEPRTILGGTESIADEAT